jgi:phospholipid/cholesterol/gamma-HCH transport system substrate-binding protein
MDKLTIALDDFSRVMKGVDEVLGNQELRENIRRAVADIPPLVAETRTTVASARETLSNIDKVVGNLEGLTAPLGERGEQLAELLISSIENMDILTGDMSKFAYALNSSEGTVGRLIRDRELYDNLNTVAKDIDYVVRQLSGQIKIISNRLDPIVNDIRVFTDAIARDPGSIIRGAVQPSIRK